MLSTFAKALTVFKPANLRSSLIPLTRLVKLPTPASNPLERIYIRRKGSKAITGQTTSSPAAIAEIDSAKLEHWNSSTRIANELMRQSHPEPRLVMFADGSFSPKYGAGGAGVVWKHFDQKERTEPKWKMQGFGAVPARCSNDMESYALAAAIRLAANEISKSGSKSGFNPSVQIFTDSKHALLKQKEVSGSGDQDHLDKATAWPSISAAMLKNMDAKVSCRWVKGHNSVEGNELAHMLAKRERKEAESKIKRARKDRG